MEKKKIETTKVQSGKPIAGQKKSLNNFIQSTFIPLAVCMLYFAIHFITDFGAYDAMGPQWFYMAALDMLVIIFILVRKEDYQESASDIIKNIFSKLYILFFVLAGLSIFTAINKTEGWVGLVRIIATVVAYFNISILLYRRIDLFKWIAHILSLILLIESIEAISQYLNENLNSEVASNVLDLKGTTGNKNIFSASLVVKIPFAIYCIITSKVWGKVLYIVTLGLASLTIFIISARASYISLILIAILYFIHCLLEYRKTKKSIPALYQISYVLFPIIASLFIFQILNANIKAANEEARTSNSVTQRLSSIVDIKEEGTFIRIRLWMHAIDYTTHHPLIGCGTSNWKIASIPYQRTITNDLIVPVHAHNDFVENFAELGLPGGIVYLSLFVCIFLFSLSVYRSKSANQGIKYVSLFSFLAFTGYSIDAFFNFPLERPISQILFALVVALNVISFIESKKEETNRQSDKDISSIMPIVGLTSILLLLPALYVTYSTYQSLILQKSVMADLNNEPLKMDWKEVIAKFPPIPNLTATAQPVDAVKGRYLYEAGHYDDALVLLDKGREANPAIGYSEFLKAGLYFKIGKIDSARRNGLYAFYTRPRAKTYFQTLIAILAKQKDTVEIKRAFTEINKYRKFGFAWNLYVLGMLNATGKGTPELLTLTDSAIHMFADDTTAVKDLTIRRMEIIQHMAQVSGVNNSVSDLTAAQNYYRQAVAAFGSGNAAKDNLGKAAELFIKAGTLNPADYTNYENAAICYYNLQNFSKALIYFDKALEKGSSNGKSDFFKGVVLINLGKKDEGCKSLVIARNRGYKEKEAELNTILKNNCGL